MTKPKCRWSPKTTAATTVGDPASGVLNVQNNLIFFTSLRKTLNKRQRRIGRQSEVMVAVRFDCSKHKCTRRSLHSSSFSLSSEGGRGLSTLRTYHHTRHSQPWPVGGAQPHITPPHRACAGTSLHLRGTQALVHMCAVNASVPLLLLIYLITYASNKAHSCCH